LECDTSRFVAASLLLIDDDPRNVPEQAQHTFHAPEYKVDIVGTGRDGVAAVRLIAARLPRSDGWRSDCFRTADSEVNHK